MKYILPMLLTALFFGRPTASQHKDAIAAKVATHLNMQEQNMLYSAASTVILDKHLVVHDFYIFSLAEVQGQVISIGALRLVHVRTQLLTLKLLTL
jgi:hypothetical protein